MTSPTPYVWVSKQKNVVTDATTQTFISFFWDVRTSFFIKFTTFHDGYTIELFFGYFVVVVIGACEIDGINSIFIP